MSSPKPNMNYSMGDLFGNFALNWETLSPALWVLFGVLFGTWLVKKVYDRFVGE